MDGCKVTRTFPIKAIKRTCGDCTACCEGWLDGVAYDRYFWPGRPCHFVTKEGCSIYKDRPEEPCKSFQCAWLINDKVPEWLKPSISKVILVYREKNGVQYLSASEAGSKMPVEVLSWLFMEYANGNIPNLMYQIHGYWNYAGTKEFCDAMTKRD
jgi:hypothetical protein